MRKAPAQPVNGLIDGLRLLQELAVHEGPASCVELARKMGVETTRMNRLLKTLDHLGMADRLPDRRYQAGPGIHVLAAQALSKSRLLQEAARRLESIPAPGCIKALGALWNDKVSYLLHHSPERDLLEALGGHKAYPATMSSIGMALLARLEEEEIETLYSGREIPGFASLSALQTELERTRKRGHGRLETEPGIISIAFAVGEPAQGAAALSGPMDAKTEETLSAALSNACAEINSTLAVEKRACGEAAKHSEERKFLRRGDGAA